MSQFRTLKGMTRKLTLLFFSLFWKIIERVISLIDLCFIHSFWRYFIFYDMQGPNTTKHMQSVENLYAWVLLWTNLMLMHQYFERIYLIVTKLCNSLCICDVESSLLQRVVVLATQLLRTHLVDKIWNSYLCGWLDSLLSTITWKHVLSLCSCFPFMASSRQLGGRESWSVYV